ncbi:MAG: methyltransferase domain-containing protein, partial [Armatimonadetes bacterium]|nr:methyltransferase domain-containing protein [Armatimonadota bacterium]
MVVLLAGQAPSAPVWRGALVPPPPAPLYDPACAPEQLEGPARDRWQQPTRLVAALELQPGDTVADVGTGSGYLLPYLSRAVGREGLVFAEEIQAEYLPALERQAAALGNVRVVLGTATNPRLPPNSLDCAVLLTVYHEVARPLVLLRALAACLRPGGRLAIIDFDPDRGGDPPPPAGHAVRERDVRAAAAATGWIVEQQVELHPSQF